MIVVSVTFGGLIIFGLLLWIAVHRFYSAPPEKALENPRFGPNRPARDERFMKRFRPRHEESQAQLCWIHEGRKNTVKSRVLDLSDDGVQVRVDVPLEPQMSVVIEIPRMRLAGTATVRYCQQKKRSYNVGLSFRGPLFRTP